jgi:hypothetical protein
MGRFNPFTNEDADFTEPMSKDGEFKDIVSDIAFDQQTRRQFMRRLSNGLVGIGAANNFGQIVYKTKDDRVVGGHRVHMEVNSKVEGIDVSFRHNDGKYTGERGHLVLPVSVKNSGLGNIDGTINLELSCQHDSGYEYKSNEFINSIGSEKTVYPIITTKNKISEYGKPRQIHMLISLE